MIKKHVMLIMELIALNMAMSINVDAKMVILEEIANIVSFI
jgi:hypothetical protein